MDEKRLAEIKEREAGLVKEVWEYADGFVFENKQGNPVICGANFEPMMISQVVGEFVANARQDIPGLVSEVERLREALQGIANHFDMYYDRKPTENPQYYHCLAADKIAKEALAWQS